MKRKNKYAVGVDEAGRGPLAGPVVVAAVKAKLNSKILKGIKDSKKLTAKQREWWYKILKENFECHYVSVNNKVIDRIGIQKAVLLCIQRLLRNFTLQHNSWHGKKPDIVFLDGLLKAPKHYIQRTIIKGDEKIPLISAASIIAKVARDRKMLGLHKKYRKYGFNKHKGYGTKMHYRQIRKNGISKIHRKSFCKKI